MNVEVHESQFRWSQVITFGQIVMVKQTGAFLHVLVSDMQEKLTSAAFNKVISFQVWKGLK